MPKSSSLITGGLGMIGSALANSLSGDTCIITRSTKNANRLERKDVKVVVKDIGDVTKRDLVGYDVIYHCASTVDNYNILTDPFIDVETNVKGTLKLLEACKDLAIKPKFVYISTFFVYGNEYTRFKKAVNEESKTDPLALYPATKLCAESIVKLYSRLYKIPYLICRLTNVYSDKEVWDNPKKGALNYLIMRAIKGEELAIYKGGNFKRDYIYVDDVVAAIKFIVDKKICNETFLIGYGKPVFFKDLITYLYQAVKSTSQIRKVDPPAFHRLVGITDFSADTKKINRLGWKAKVNYKQGIQKVVNTYKMSREYSR